MIWHPNEREIVLVQQLSASDRYKYFVKKVADQQVLWSLWFNGWALAGNESEREVVPIWPHPVYAEICANGEWRNYEPRQIELDGWMERWLPGIKRDNRLIAVFPSSTDKGVVVDSDFLKKSLEEEIRNY